MSKNICMLKYYKKHILSLKKLLDDIDPQSNDFGPLLAIQKQIVNHIVNTEKRIKEKKNIQKEIKVAIRSRANTKNSSATLKDKLNKVNDTIIGYKYLLYIWRCFGDGIVFKYISKWNLKRLLFETDSSAIKQQAGYLSGKKGLKREWLLLECAIRHKVPAILCDITNSIRHGDLCLLGVADPYVIEVKSSSNENKRTERQKDSISRIHEYLKNDIGTIGGIEGMQRVVFPLEEKHHNKTINKVIGGLKEYSYIEISPEPGLHYIGFSSTASIDYSNLFNSVNEPIVYMLNEAKIEKRWDNYYPFTLSIKDGQSLYEFINGDYFLLVIIDGSIVKNMFKNIGYDLSIIMTEDIGFAVTKKSINGDKPIINIISEHFVGRLGFEFISLEWFLRKEAYMLKEIEDSLPSKSKVDINNIPVGNIVSADAYDYYYQIIFGSTT